MPSWHMSLYAIMAYVESSVAIARPAIARPSIVWGCHLIGEGGGGGGRGGEREGDRPP